jgi:hypothetical protein
MGRDLIHLSRGLLIARSSSQFYGGGSTSNRLLWSRWWRVSPRPRPITLSLAAGCAVESLLPAALGSFSCSEHLQAIIINDLRLGSTLKHAQTRR